MTSPITASSRAPTSWQTVSTASSRSGSDDGDHPLLALGDHDLDRRQVGLPQRDAVEVDVEARASAPGHLGERGGEPGGAEVLQRLDEPALGELEAGLDQLLPRERVADLDGRALVLVLVGELLAREDAGTADAVAARRRAVEDDEVPGPVALARVTRSAGRRPTHIAFTSGLPR